MPRPTLNALRDDAEAGGDAAFQAGINSLDTAGGDGSGQLLAALDPNRDNASVSPSQRATSALGVGRVAPDKAAAIVNPETTADDVSFSVYLSTLWSVEEAQRYWLAMQEAVPDVIQGKQLEIEEIAVADSVDPFYRVLLTPFASDPEAQALCDQIETRLRTHDCNVVVRDKTETAGG